MAPRATRASLHDRRAVIKKLEEIRETRRDWLRRQILEKDRIDLLATEVLGLQVEPHHFAMIAHQHRYSPDPGCMILCWRGAGKTSITSVARTVFKLLKNPDERILLASKSGTNAVGILSEVKRRLVLPEVEEIFGPQIGDKWDDVEINVAGRKSASKESNVTAIGAESAVVSRHYDAINADDLVDEKNSRTRYMRDQIKTFLYKTLLPTLEPGGEFSVQGTRYHDQDLYGHLVENELAGRVLVIPALVGSEEHGYRSNWPAKFPVEWLLQRRASMGSILFDGQYRCDTAKMKGGGVFDIDDVDTIALSQVPAGLPRYLGVDLAISQKAKADRFFAVVIAYDAATDTVYVVDNVYGRFSFVKQREIVIDLCDRHSIVRGAIEAQFYQAALWQEVKRERPDLPIVAWQQRVDKLTRAQRFSARFEGGKVHFVHGLDTLVEELIAFPDGEHDDGFDGLDLAVAATRARSRKPARDREPGVF